MAAIRELDWSAHLGKQTRIYRNLQNGRMSIQAKSPKSWKVVGHVLDCVLGDVKFHVVESTRQRVLTQQRRTVHAWGQGTLIGVSDLDIYAPIDLTYNPFLSDRFLERGTQNRIIYCKYLVMRNNQVWLTPDAVDDARCCPLLRLVWNRPRG
ncbi:hypothetical protein PN498_26385 [Oscillatoria sp. CS-180]|uniref:hypothetical protein n=1 Tax=Oscillatoria sp. CS-180 TaxID=3021720 RepID=UPI00233055F7|nr:hypothetical protein [Oscillatoria sp. CS-180]MDB9529546.1 hypothetical protein [Oscillatoria sp. CS-180]